jgi:hypothetical protein
MNKKLEQELASEISMRIVTCTLFDEQTKKLADKDVEIARLKEESEGLEVVLAEIEELCSKSGIDNFDTLCHTEMVEGLVGLVNKLKPEHANCEECLNHGLNRDKVVNRIKKQRENAQAKSSKLNAEKREYMKIVWRALCREGVIRTKIDRKYNTYLKAQAKKRKGAK